MDPRSVPGQGKALGDPTRYAIVELLHATPGGLAVSDLAAPLGLRHNAIRKHLARLTTAGLVVGVDGPRPPRGRPARIYRLAPGALERWNADTPADELSRMLLEMVTTGACAAEVGRVTGRRLALDDPTRAEPVARIEGVTRRLGFDPQRVATAAGFDLLLQRCPFASAARQAADVVCTLHRGVAEGVCQSVGGVRVLDLVVGNPDRGGCRLVLST